VNEIPAGATTKIKDGKRRLALYRVEERGVVLADIVVSRPFQKARANRS
jgi:hypothetical protein